jgi:glucose-1-phosphate adenylyltransferase
MHDILIILAGGASSRMKKENKFSLDNNLKNQANSRSKALISLDGSGRPVLDYLLYNAKQAGYKKIYLIVGEEHNLFKAFYGHKTYGNMFHGLRIHYAIQYIPKNRTKPFGTADALIQAVDQYPELVKSTYTVCNSDNLYSVEALKALRVSKYSNALISYDRDGLNFSLEKILRFALILTDEDGFLHDIVEKPNSENIEYYKDSLGKLRVSMNIFKFDGTMFTNYLINCPVNQNRNEKELPTALLNMVKEQPKSVFGIPISEHIPDLTSKDDIEIVKLYIEKHYSHINWE